MSADEDTTMLDAVDAEQTPLTVQQKSEEELARIAERKKESGRRLQEQAAKMRLEKLMRKEQEREYYKKLAEKLIDANKKETKRLLDAEEMKDEAHLERTIREYFPASAGCIRRF